MATLTIPVEIERMPMRVHRYTVTVTSPSDPQMAVCSSAATRWGARRLARAFERQFASEQIREGVSA